MSDRSSASSLGGAESPSFFTPENNFGAGEEYRLLIEIDWPGTAEGLIGRQAVYEHAASVAVRQQVERMIDLGAGGGAGLGFGFSGFAAEYIQVDRIDRHADLPLPEGASSPRFLRADLEDAGDLDALIHEFEDEKRTLFVLAGVMERLRDPRLMLRALRLLLKKNPGSRAIISASARDRNDGSAWAGLPVNPGHFREWTLEEFGPALHSAGLTVHHIGQASVQGPDRAGRTLIAETGCTLEEYRDFLARLRLPPQTDHLLLTTEHAEAEHTGGIGTYCLHVQDLASPPPIILFSGAHGLPTNWSEFIREKGWLHCAQLCGRAEDGYDRIVGTNPVEALRAAFQLIFLYDDLRIIEYQDFAGIGVHIAQAKRARVLPPSLTVMAYAHGTHFHLDHATGKLSTHREISIDVQERLSLELADLVVFPSAFLRDLYIDIQGLCIREHVHLPHPQRFPMKDSDLSGWGDRLHADFLRQGVRAEGVL